MLLFEVSALFDSPSRGMSNVSCGSAWRLTVTPCCSSALVPIVKSHSLGHSDFFLLPVRTKLLPLMRGTKTHRNAFGRPDRIINEFFKNIFHFFETYFRSPFGHLPLTFRQTLIVSSLIFSTNLRILCVWLLCVFILISSFSPPPVYPVSWSGA